MTPTLTQLKKRPALWVLAGAEPRITMPDGFLWMWESDHWVLRNACRWHKHALECYEFAGWL